MIFLFNGVLKNGVVTPLVLQQNSKEIKKMYATQIYKTEANNHSDYIFGSWACELYKEVIIIETLYEIIEIEFIDNYSVNTAMQYLAEKMGSISDYNSDYGTFYTKLKDDI